MRAQQKRGKRNNNARQTADKDYNQQEEQDTDRNVLQSKLVDGMFDQRVGGSSVAQNQIQSFEVESRPSPMNMNGKISYTGFKDNIALIQETGSSLVKTQQPYYADEQGKPVKIATFDNEFNKIDPIDPPKKKVQRPVEIFNVAHKSGYQNKYWCMAHEIVGTAFLHLAVQWGTCSGVTPQAVGLSVFAFAVVLGQVSGGHMNPAVSTALFMQECRRNYTANFITFFLYIISQILGGMLGIMIGFIGIGAEVHPLVKTLEQRDRLGKYFIAYLCPANGCHVTGYFGQVVFVEMLMTFFFAGSVVAIAKWDGARDGPANCLVIGISLGTGIVMAAGLSGGAVNPSVALLQPFYQTLATEWRLPNFDLALIERTNYHGAYVLGTLLGGLLAGSFHRWAIPMARDLKALAEADAKKQK